MRFEHSLDFYSHKILLQTKYRETEKAIFDFKDKKIEAWRRIVERNVLILSVKHAKVEIEEAEK